MESTENKSTAEQRGRALMLLGLAFSAVALSVCGYLFFFVEEAGLRGQALYWFLAALLAATLPFLRHMGPGRQESNAADIELSLKTLREEIRKVEEKVESLNRDLLNALEQMQEQEEQEAEPQRASRKELLGSWEERAEDTPDMQKLKMQELFSRDHLRKARISVKQVKQMLKALGLYEGSLNDTFDAQLPLAIAKFQKKEGISIDGVSGPATLARLRKHFASRPASRERPAP